jgi:hypothetical protein
MRDKAITILICSLALLIASCDSTTQNQKETTESKTSYTILDSFNGLKIMMNTDSQNGHTYTVSVGDSQASRVFFAREHSTIESTTIEQIKWANKDYMDYRVAYRTFGEYSYGSNIGGWEKKFHFVELIDGKTGQSYFKAQPYFWSFEEHNLTSDTSHPLAATSCHFQYRIILEPDENLMRIDSLIGSCLPDYEEGEYIFQNNELVLNKD